LNGKRKYIDSIRGTKKERKYTKEMFKGVKVTFIITNAISKVISMKIGKVLIILKSFILSVPRYIPSVNFDDI